ncbi:DUF1292 domain-containing protein [Clostridium pasteurianum]|uniref:DUF1292 domain-containing protein n=1 Tax=Clostridium pasteurianum BC1 TaxID=86416 RepID=R4KBA3_CLOPA|nr:DUF1292 domain-containing protein [Clostridium pasteurianum]AGK97814.1 Protein of unknown function (DUF1292) [Clostridium pasteurianum BC1]
MSENEKVNACSIDGCGCGENEHQHEEHSHECDCGCEDHEHETFSVELEDEHGNVVSCDVIDGFVYNDLEFALVQNPQDGSVYLFKVVGEGEEGELVIPDDEEFKAATAYYESTLEKEK